MSLRLERIEQIEDPRVAVFRNVQDSALRERHGLFVVESRLCVERLVECARWPVDALLVSDPALEALRETLERCIPDVPVFVADASVLNEVVGYPLHRGCMAAATRKTLPELEDVLKGHPRLLVGLEEVANPENVGNVFRNAAAFGADAVLLSSGCADPLYRKAIRVSMAATLQLPFARVATWRDAREPLRGDGMTTLALTTNAEAPPLSTWLAAHPEADRLTLILGSEGEGLEDATVRASDAQVRIPMAPAVDSLNVATASGIALHACFERTSKR